MSLVLLAAVPIISFASGVYYYLSGVSKDTHLRLPKEVIEEIQKGVQLKPVMKQKYRTFLDDIKERPRLRPVKRVQEQHDDPLAFLRNHIQKLRPYV